MKQTICERDFIRAFEDMSRSDSFSERGLRKLFEYLEQFEQDTGVETELDVIALCCEYSEEPLADVLKNYGLESIDELRDNTTVIEVDDETIIYAIY